MTTDDHAREVYAYFGLAVYSAQVLEHGIVNAMVIGRLSRRERFTANDIDAFMGQQFEQTLGTLIRNLRSEMPLPDDLEDLLRLALRTRNWLCHDYFRERVTESMTVAGGDKMVDELADAKELFLRADERLEAIVQPIAERYGVTQAVIQAAFQALRREQGMID